MEVITQIFKGKKNEKTENQWLFLDPSKLRLHGNLPPPNLDKQANPELKLRPAYLKQNPLES